MIFKRLLRAQAPIPCYNTVLWSTQSTKDHALAPHWSRDMTSDCLCRFHGSAFRRVRLMPMDARDLAALLRHRSADLAPRCAARSSPRRRPVSPRFKSGTHGTALNCLEKAAHTQTAMLWAAMHQRCSRALLLATRYCRHRAATFCAPSLPMGRASILCELGLRRRGLRLSRGR